MHCFDRLHPCDLWCDSRVRCCLSFGFAGSEKPDGDLESICCLPISCSANVLGLLCAIWCVYRGQELTRSNRTIVPKTFVAKFSIGIATLKTDTSRSKSNGSPYRQEIPGFDFEDFNRRSSFRTPRSGSSEPVELPASDSPGLVRSGRIRPPPAQEETTHPVADLESTGCIMFLRRKI